MEGPQFVASVSDESIKFNQSYSLTEDFGERWNDFFTDALSDGRGDYRAEKSIELVGIPSGVDVEVVVSSPQNNNSLSGPYTTYLLSGNVGDFNFSVRKR